jgi:hypothetical protein
MCDLCLLIPESQKAVKGLSTAAHRRPVLNKEYWLGLRYQSASAGTPGGTYTYYYWEDSGLHPPAMPSSQAALEGNWAHWGASSTAYEPSSNDAN